MDIQTLCNEVRQTAYDIHVYHGHGHLEKVYENGLAHRLHKAGHEVAQQHPIAVYDEDGTILGEFFADLLVDDELVVELKAVRTIAPEHTAQLLGYLKSSRRQHGLLINFGSYKFQIKKYLWDPTHGRHGTSGMGSLSILLTVFFVLTEAIQR